MWMMKLLKEKTGYTVLAKRDQHLNVLALMFHHQKTLSDQNEIDVSYFCTVTA